MHRMAQSYLKESVLSMIKQKFIKKRTRISRALWYNLAAENGIGEVA